MKRFYFIKFLEFSLYMLGVVAPLSCAASDIRPNKSQYLILARAFKATLVQENDSYTEKGDLIIAPSTYRVTFDNVLVEEGDAATFPETIEVNINTRNIDYVLESKRVHLLVENKAGALQVLHWGLVSFLVCLPETLVADEYADYYFDPGFDDRKGKKCRFVDRKSVSVE